MAARDTRTVTAIPDMRIRCYTQSSIGFEDGTDVVAGDAVMDIKCHKDTGPAARDAANLRVSLQRWMVTPSRDTDLPNIPLPGSLLALNQR